jgi:hypothetical protein
MAYFPLRKVPPDCHKLCTLIHLSACVFLCELKLFMLSCMSTSYNNNNTTQNVKRLLHHSCAVRWDGCEFANCYITSIQPWELILVVLLLPIS